MIGESVSLRNHYDLVAWWNEYVKLSDFDDGTPDRVGKYLKPHPAETDGTTEGKRNYTTRLQRLYNKNFVARYLALHTGHLSQHIEVSGLTGTTLDDILSDATGYMESHEIVAWRRLRLYLRDGRVGTLVDGPDNTAPDSAGARASGERSYQVVFEATQIRDWEYFDEGPRKGQLRYLVLEHEPEIDEQGQIVRCLRRFEQPDADGAFFVWQELAVDATAQPAMGTPNADLASYRLRYDRVMGTAEEVCVVTAEGIGGLTYIPFVIMGGGPRDSIIRDVMQHNEAWLNLNSCLSNIIWNQGFQKCIFAGIKAEEIAKMAEWTVIVTTNPDARIFTIPPGDPVACQKEIDRLESYIERVGKFQYNQLADDTTKQTQSADSKALDMRARKVIYNKTLDYLTDIERAIWKMHAEFEGASPDGVEVTIERDYGIDDPQAEHAELTLLSILAGEKGVFEVQDEVLKVLTSRPLYVARDGETQGAVRERLYQAIDDAAKRAADARKQMEALQSALVPTAASGPGMQPDGGQTPGTPLDANSTPQLDNPSLNPQSLRPLGNNLFKQMK